MTRHCIFLVEDHPVMRAGYVSLIDREADLEICGVATNAEEVFEHVLDASPDIIVGEFDLPGVSGLGFIKRLRTLLPTVPILVISRQDEMMYAEQALAAGAQGYLMKDEPSRRIVEAIRHILAGRPHVSDALKDRMLMKHTRRGTARTVVTALTDREVEVFEHFGCGETTQKVAGLLGLSTKTVESHRANIKRKLGILTASEFTQRAVLWVGLPGLDSESPGADSPEA